MISAARIVVLFAIALSCAHGEEGRFVSGAFQHPKRTTGVNNMGTCVVAGAPASNGHPQVNVHLSQEPMDVNADSWDELQRQLTEVSQHVQLLRSRMASWSASHQEKRGKLPNGSEFSQ